MAKSRFSNNSTTGGTDLSGAPMPGDSGSVENSGISDGLPMTNEVNGDDVTGDAIVMASDAPTDQMSSDDTGGAVSDTDPGAGSVDPAGAQSQQTQSYTLKRAVNYEGVEKIKGDEVALTESQAKQLRKSGHI